MSPTLASLLSVATTVCQVPYRRSACDAKERFYALGPAAQKLPRALRHLLFGVDHGEVDLIGAFYELVRRYAARQRGLGTLPNVIDARPQLASQLLELRAHKDPAPLAKFVLNVVLSAPPVAAVRRLHQRKPR